MKRFLALAGWLLASSLFAQPPSDPRPVRLLLTPARPPVPSLRFALLPELREQTPGNGAILYRKAGEMVEKLPRPLSDQIPQITRWQRMPSRLPRDEVRKVLAMYQESLELLHRGARSEFCDFEIVQRLREKGISASLKSIEQMRHAVQLLYLKARLELAEDRPDLALRTLQTAYALGRDVGKEPTLICSLVGMAIVSMANDVLGLTLRHPKTPNLSASLRALPRPFIDLRQSLQGERLLGYGTFPGLLEVANNPDAGPLPPNEIEKMTTQVEQLTGKEMAERQSLAAKIRRQHEAAKKALVVAGRSREQVEKWPHIQVALMHSLLEYDQLLDEILLWQGFPYHQAAEPLQTLEKKIQASRHGGLAAPAIPLASLLLPTIEPTLLGREGLERQFAAYRVIEAIRLYAANHEGKLPPTLAHIKEVPLPVCPVTGKSFEYRLDGDRGFLSAPPVPKSVGDRIQPMRYEITMRR